MKTGPIRFGEQRLIRRDLSHTHRALYRLMGVGEPAHYLHYRYLVLALAEMHETPSKILDAGCGAGDVTFYLARRYPTSCVLGVDVDAALVERNRIIGRGLGLANVDFKVTSIEDPLKDSFDLIVAIDVLEHLHKQQQALRGLRDALNVGGVAFFHIPTVRPRPVPFSRWLHEFHAWSEAEHVADDLTAEQFETATIEAGFATIRRWRTFGYWTGELATSLFALPYRK